MGILERRQFARKFHDLVFAKIEGKITQRQLEHETKNLSSEQLSLGIGASTEAPGATYERK